MSEKTTTFTYQQVPPAAAHLVTLKGRQGARLDLDLIPDGVLVAPDGQPSFVVTWDQIVGLLNRLGPTKAEI